MLTCNRDAPAGSVLRAQPRRPNHHGVDHRQCERSLRRGHPRRIGHGHQCGNQCSHHHHGELGRHLYVPLPARGQLHGHRGDQRFQKVSDRPVQGRSESDCPYRHQTGTRRYHPDGGSHRRGRAVADRNASHRRHAFVHQAHQPPAQWPQFCFLDPADSRCRLYRAQRHEHCGPLHGFWFASASERQSRADQ